MKIIRSGMDAFIHECKNCRCLFAYGNYDVTPKTWRNETCYFVDCPECGKKEEVFFKKRSFEDK